MANKIIQLSDGTNTLYPKMDNQTGTITASSGWTATTSRLKKTGNVVDVTFNANGGTLATGWNALGTISTGYRPPLAIDFAGIDNVSGESVQAQVTSGGVINVYKFANQSLNNNFRIHTTYIID